VPYKIKSVHLLVIKVIITKMHGATHIKVKRGSFRQSQPRQLVGENNLLPCPESNPGSLVLQPVVKSLYHITHPSFQNKRVLSKPLNWSHQTSQAHRISDLLPT
jgi:hypothetical protein